MFIGVVIAGVWFGWEGLDLILKNKKTTRILIIEFSYSENWSLFNPEEKSLFFNALSIRLVPINDAFDLALVNWGDDAWDQGKLDFNELAGIQIPLDRVQTEIIAAAVKVSSYCKILS